MAEWTAAPTQQQLSPMTTTEGETMAAMDETAELDWTNTLSYLMALLFRPLEVTIAGPSGGVLVDGVAWLVEVRDACPGDDPTMLLLRLEVGTFGEPLTLYLPSGQIVGVELDGIDGNLAIDLQGGERFDLRPLTDDD